MGVPSQPARQRQLLLENLYDSITAEGTPSFMPFPADPQVSSIARKEHL
jgi:hypothetical protein